MGVVTIFDGVAEASGTPWVGIVGVACAHALRKLIIINRATIGFDFILIF